MERKEKEEKKETTRNKKQEAQQEQVGNSRDEGKTSCQKPVPQNLCLNPALKGLLVQGHGQEDGEEECCTVYIISGKKSGKKCRIITFISRYQA